MELKPTKGLKVKVNAQREALFGDESVSVTKVHLPDGSARNGIMTGVTLAGYCEVEMPSLDGKKHWYPVEALTGEKGEKIVEEEIVIEVEEDDDSDE
jgi:hypothetical protein